GLEVILVSDELPEASTNPTATYLAQRTQVGSGNTQKHVRPRNRAGALPTRRHAGSPTGQSLREAPATAGTASDERVLSTVTWSTNIRYLGEAGAATAERNDPLLVEETPPAEAGPDETGPAQLRGPARDELWITPDTRAASLAPYLDAWRRKVERIGTLNYPTVAKVAGSASPVVEVGIASDGKLERVLIRRSSGNAELDQAALEILKMAGPFDPFPPELARDYRVLRFAYEWQFTGEHDVSGTVSVP
ncbi:MAG: TonB family protein, partial [Gammaproteobacteria bacterium]|nr:TonB family protein [Gammaproteobacteria bacterium]